MPKEHYVILGGGISGLALGWYLKQRFQDQIQLTIIEKDSRVGGWIRTVHDEQFLFEQGPRSCRTKGAGTATLQLIEELGLENEVIVGSSDARKRYLYVNKQLQYLPSHLLSLFNSPLMRSVWKDLWREWRKSCFEGEDESIYDFFSRRFSADFANRFIDPMVSGIFAGDIRKLSLKSCFPQLHRWESQFGSLTKAMLFDRSNKHTYSPFVERMKKTPIFSFKQGMETLIKALSEKLISHIKLNEFATSLKVSLDHIEIEMNHGASLKANKVFLALPAQATVDLLQNSFPLENIPFPKIESSSIVAVNMGWTNLVLSHSGFGYLIPSSEKEKILGVIWDSSVFPEQNHLKNETRLTVMMGGAHHPEFAHASHFEVEELAKKTVKQHLKIEDIPQVMRVHIAKKAIPQYLLGHSTRLEQLESCLTTLSNRITLHGSAWYGVSVNDCVLRSQSIVHSI